MKWAQKKIAAVLKEWRDNQISYAVAVQRLADLGVINPEAVLAKH
jgi:hypothetical protein